MFNKIKRLLGFCECKGCFCKSEYELNIKGINATKNICSKHVRSITVGSKLKEIELEDGTRFEIN